MAFILFYLANLDIQGENLMKFAEKDLRSARLSFDELKDLDVKMLASGLEIITSNEKIKELYLEKDREKLYNYVSPLFEDIRNRYGITHWYFIGLDGKTFLRVHNKVIYDDDITRFTFENAKKSGEISSGIELGKTAYALRVVIPYYDGDELIGYVELAEEIDHFFEILKKQTSDDFILVTDKNYLDELKWGGVREIAGLKDNFNDLETHVIVSPQDVNEKDIIMNCFSNENLYDAVNGENFFQEIENGENIYKCAGFHLTDAGDRDSGIIFVSLDISQYVFFTQHTNFVIGSFLITIYVLILLMSYFLFRHNVKRK